MDKKLAQETVKQRTALYKRVFTSPDGKKVLEDLNKMFCGSTLRKVDGAIDLHGSIAAAGCRETVLYIELMMRTNDALD